MVTMYLKGKPIKHIYACFPAVFVPFHLFNSEGRVTYVIDKESYLVIKFFLCSLRKPLIILLKSISAEDFHFLRSERKSSMESNDLVFPAAISLSASASAFSQLNSLKYGGRDNAYLINSATAASVFGLFADFLYRSISSKTSSGIFIVNSRLAIFLFLLRQDNTPLVFKSIYSIDSLKHDKNSSPSWLDSDGGCGLKKLSLINPHARNLLEVGVEGEDREVVFDDEGCDGNIS
jgi:hypothetical protein